MCHFLGGPAVAPAAVPVVASVVFCTSLIALVTDSAFAFREFAAAVRTS